MDALMLFLYPTNYCNKGCDNCYNPSVNDKMSIETANKIVAWVKKTCIEENVKNIRPTFLGGEPLNVADMVMYLVDKFESEIPWVTPLPPAGYTVHTNGDLFTDDLLREFKKRNITIALNPTYESMEEVERKVLKIKAITKGCALSICWDENNLNRAEDLANVVVKYHLQARTNRLYHGGNIEGYVEKYSRQMNKFLHILLNSPKPIYPNWLVENAYPTWDSPKNCYSCGRWLAVIDVDGTIRSCNADMSTVIGHIDTHSWKDLKSPQRWSAKNIAECQGCEFINLCQAGCPYTHKLTYGTYNHKSPFCAAFKELFPIVKQIKERWVNR